MSAMWSFTDPDTGEVTVVNNRHDEPGRHADGIDDNALVVLDDLVTGTRDVLAVTQPTVQEVVDDEEVVTRRYPRYRILYGIGPAAAMRTVKQVANVAPARVWADR